MLRLLHSFFTRVQNGDGCGMKWRRWRKVMPTYIEIVVVVVAELCGRKARIHKGPLRAGRKQRVLRWLPKNINRKMLLFRTLKEKGADERQGMCVTEKGIKQQQFSTTGPVNIHPRGGIYPLIWGGGVGWGLKVAVTEREYSRKSEFGLERVWHGGECVLF